MSKWIEILVVEPGAAPRPARVENTLEKMAEMVGGQPEMGCFLPHRVLLVSREDTTGLAPNRRNPANGEMIAGTFLLCGFDDSGFASLTKMQQQEFWRCLVQPDEFLLIPANTDTPNDMMEAAYSLWESVRDGYTVVLTKWGGSGKGAAD